MSNRMIPKDEFLSGKQCLRCGIFGTEKVCKLCKDLKKCRICTIILRPEFVFYKYTPNTKGTFYKEHSYIIVSPYPPFIKNQCYDCIGWELGMKYWCYGCGEWFQNTLNNYKINGNFCDKCNV